MRIHGAGGEFQVRDKHAVLRGNLPALSSFTCINAYETSNLSAPQFEDQQTGDSSAHTPAMRFARLLAGNAEPLGRKVEEIHTAIAFKFE